MKKTNTKKVLSRKEVSKARTLKRKSQRMGKLALATLALSGSLQAASVPAIDNNVYVSTPIVMEISESRYASPYQHHPMIAAHVSISDFEDLPSGGQKVHTSAGVYWFDAHGDYTDLTFECVTDAECQDKYPHAN